jgi:predicted component of type VI protein secretion system
MSEQAGSSVAAIQARQAVLARQHDAIAEADRMLAEALASAHAAMRESVRRLDAIAAEIDSAVPDQAELAVDTPMGAREFQKFLVAKQREIAAIVAEAHELDRAKSAVLERLRAEYARPAG